MAMTICKVISNHLEHLLVLPAKRRVFDLPWLDFIGRLHASVSFFPAFSLPDSAGNFLFSSLSQKNRRAFFHDVRNRSNSARVNNRWRVARHGLSKPRATSLCIVGTDRPPRYCAAGFSLSAPLVGGEPLARWALDFFFMKDNHFFAGRLVQGAH